MGQVGCQSRQTLIGQSVGRRRRRKRWWADPTWLWARLDKMADGMAE